MKERPILFSGPMVRAILDGRKTQAVGFPRNWHLHDPEAVRACPYGVPGDRLWVRETFTPHEGGYVYKADWDVENPDVSLKGLWKPSILMPRSACRILLSIQDVWVERLHDMSEKDAKAEGVIPIEEGTAFPYTRAFEALWREIHGERNEESNPWVWVAEFEVLEVRK